MQFHSHENPLISRIFWRKKQVFEDENIIIWLESNQIWYSLLSIVLFLILVGISTFQFITGGFAGLASFLFYQGTILIFIVLLLLMNPLLIYLFSKADNKIHLSVEKLFASNIELAPDFFISIDDTTFTRNAIEQSDTQGEYKIDHDDLYLPLNSDVDLTIHDTEKYDVTFRIEPLVLAFKNKLVIKIKQNEGLVRIRPPSVRD